MIQYGVYIAFLPIFASLNFYSTRANIGDNRTKFLTYKLRVTPSIRHYSKSRITSTSEEDLTTYKTKSKGIQSENPLNDNKPMILYSDFVKMKHIIIEENGGKSGIYLITHKTNGDFYVGQTGDIAKRFRDYTLPSYLTRITDKVNTRIGRALKKYGYSSFLLQC